ncbi:MAG: class C sortase [Clostridia bacterium]|nr:class C sortase [Clostridia bacterium]
MKNKLTDILIVLLILAGISVIAYPTVSDWLSKRQNQESLTRMEAAISQLDPEMVEDMFQKARAYNELHTGHGIRDAFSGEVIHADQEYMNLLNLNGDGIMGSVEIPKIHVNLPIYHTTNSDVLEKGAGHVEGTSLPVGGETSHCAISGHRGLPSARMFTDLDQMVLGDTFLIRVLDRVMTYRVDQIVVVEPNETYWLDLEEGKDLVTLVTCTPYGVNTHRLLVRGIRIPDTMEDTQTDGTKTVAMQSPLADLGSGARIEQILMIVAPVALGLLIVIYVVTIVGESRRRRRRANGEDPDDDDDEYEDEDD